MIVLPLPDTASWPSTSRWRLAQAETRCSGAAPRPCARREALPSMPTISGASSRIVSTQATKQSEKSRPGRAFITSFSVSWLGMPRARAGAGGGSRAYAAPGLDLHEILRSPHRGAQHDGQDSRSEYSTLPACRGSDSAEKWLISETGNAGRQP